MIALSRLDLLPPVESDAPCAVCGRARPEFRCERCGAPLHDLCYWSDVATLAELDEVIAIEQDPPTVLYLCRGCRS